MKKYLIIIAVLIPIVGYSQKGFYFRFQGGVSFPVQELSSVSWSDDSKTGGFAKIGYNSGLDINWFFSENIGIFASTIRNKHQLKNDVIATKAFQAGIDSLIYAESSPWLLKYILAGPSFSKSINEKLYFEARLMCGRMLTYSPKINLKVTEVDGLKLDVSRKPSKGVSMAYGASAGFKYNITEEFWMSLSVDYLYAQPEFIYKDIISVNQNLGDINTTFGLIYRF